MTHAPLNNLIVKSPQCILFSKLKRRRIHKNACSIALHPVRLISRIHGIHFYKHGRYFDKLNLKLFLLLGTIEIDILYTLEEVLVIEFGCLFVHEQ